MFHNAGIYLWPYDGVLSAADTSRPTLSNGFAYITQVRGEKWAFYLRIFNCHVSRYYPVVSVQLTKYFIV